MANARRAATALMLSCLVVGCSSGDEDPSTTGAPASPPVAPPTTGSRSTTQETPAATEPAVTGSSRSDATASTEPITTPTQTSPADPSTDPTSAPTEAPPTDPVTEPTTAPTVSATPSTEDARAAAGARLAAQLPTAEELGLPDDWTTRDLQSGLDEGSIPRSELDAFRGVVTCPEHVVALGDGGPWAERKVNGIDPDPDGVLIIRLQLIEESGADWSQRQQALAECTPASADAFFENEAGSVAVPGSGSGEVALQRIAVFSSATATAPFPTQVVSMSANANDRTANVTMFGLNEADPFDDAVRAVLVELLTAR